MNPNIGRIVHFYDRNLEHFGANKFGPYAAIVTYVYEDGNHVDLEAFPTRVNGSDHRHVMLGEDRPDGGKRDQWWVWPARVE